MLSALQSSGERSKLLLERLALQPKSPAIIGIGEILSAQGRHSEALTRLRAVSELYNQSYRYHIALARVYHASGDIENAKLHYEHSCQLAPQNEIAIRELIALTAFPKGIQKNSPEIQGGGKQNESRNFAPSEEVRRVASQDISDTKQTSDIGATQEGSFKLDREKLAETLGKALNQSRIIEDAIPREEIKPTSESVSTVNTSTPPSGLDAMSDEPFEIPPPVIHAFKKSDQLLNDEPDIDALAREMMGIGMNEDPLSEIPGMDQSTANLDVSTEENKYSHDSFASPEEDDFSADVTSGLNTQDTVNQHESPSYPIDENGRPIIFIDRAKLAKALAGIHAAKGITPKIESEETDQDITDDIPSSNMPSSSFMSIPTPPINQPKQPVGKAPLSFEEELMAMQMQGGDLDEFISKKDTRHLESETATTKPQVSDSEYDIDAIAQEMMKAALPKMSETNDPTPVADQRQPFSDDEEIKIPTRQLAKIFQSQGAYAKAIKVYEMLIEREPENASLYDILINGLREQMK